MGRTLRRKLQKEVKKKYGAEAVDKIVDRADADFIREEVDKEIKIILNEFTISLLKCAKSNGISEIKMNNILDDVKIDLNEKVKARKSNG